MISRIVAGIVISIFVTAFLTNFLLGTLEPARSFKLNFTICKPGERKGECVECSETGLVFLPNDTFCKEKYGDSYICTSLGTCIDTGCRCNAWENCVKQGAIPVCVLKPNTCFWGRNCTIRIKARFEDMGDYFDRNSFAGYLVITHPDREIPLAKVPCYLNETKRILYKAVYDCRFDPLKLNLFSSEKPYEAYFFWRDGFKEITFYVVPNKKAKNFFEVEAYFKKSKDLKMEVENVWSKKGKWKFCSYQCTGDKCFCECVTSHHLTYTAIKFRLRGSLNGRFLVCFEFINSTIPMPASTFWSVKLDELNYLRENLGSYYDGSNIYVYNCFVVDKDEYSELFTRRPILVYDDYDYVSVSKDEEISRSTYVNITFIVFNLTDEEINLPEDIVYVSSPADSIRERVACTSNKEYKLKDIGYVGCTHDIPICCVKGCTGIEDFIGIETCDGLKEDETFPSTCIDRSAEERGMPRQIGCSKCCRTCCNAVGNSCNECAEVPCNIFCGGFGPSSWWECCKCINPYYKDECECGG